MKKSINLYWLFVGRVMLALMAALILTSNTAQAGHRHSSGNLIERLKSDGRFTTLLVALEAAGLTETVATGGEFTVFAPTDEAFAKLVPGTVETLLKPENKDKLVDILTYHVLSGSQSLIALLQNSTAETAQGTPLLVVREGSKFLVNRQPLILPWLRASNGVIYPIKGVLIPPAAPTDIHNVADVLALDGRFKTLLAAVGAAGLGEALTTGGPFTLFAPTDEAFAKLVPGTVETLLKPENKDKLVDILTYHVLGQRSRASELIFKRTAETLQGADVAIAFRHGGVFVNDSRVVNANISSPNAIIHVLDTVLLPPAPKTNLLEVLKNDGRFGTLVLALQVAGLDSVVATGGPLTIFAPTDEAFDALPPGKVAGLLADTDALKNVLLYHVVAGSKTASDLLRQVKVTTLQGSSAYVYSWWKNVFVNRSQAIEANICASNGTIHAINKVLLPPAAGGNDDEDHEDDNDESDD